MAILLAVVAGRGENRQTGRRAPAAAWRNAAWALAWASLRSRWRGLPVDRVAAQAWRPLAVVALLVVALQYHGASGGSSTSQDLSSTLATEVAALRSRSVSEAVAHRKREPEFRALQWVPTPQASPEPSLSVPAPVPYPAPPPPRFVPPPAGPDGAIVGLATWYGGIDGFGPEDTMADGTQFNPDDPTIAASNRWPLGSWLRVCLGARCIEVQVRDRGAFNHALDLSRGAFSQLAPTSSGVITVTVLRVR